MQSVKVSSSVAELLLPAVGHPRPELPDGRGAVALADAPGADVVAGVAVPSGGDPALAQGALSARAAAPGQVVVPGRGQGHGDHRHRDGQEDVQGVHVEMASSFRRQRRFMHATLLLPFPCLLACEALIKRIQFIQWGEKEQKVGRNSR